MNAKYRRVPTTFAPTVEFEVATVAVAPYRLTEEGRFEQLKSRLLLEKLEELEEPEFNSRLRRAANEAAALAWVTAYPLLVFPALFEERSAVALGRTGLQELTDQSSQGLLVA
jgi:hypothetical protein